MTPEVAKRLGELKVDPTTVTIAKKLDSAAVGVPVPVASPTPGTYKYAAKIAAGGQNIALKISTEIKDENGAWTFVDTMNSPMGEAVDTAVVDKGSLLARTRKVKQGPMTIDTSYQGAKVTGTMSNNGKDTPISTDLGGPAFAEAAGAPFVIGCLPLKEGYSATFRNFDLQKQKVKLLQLSVPSSEKVTVPAGSFEAYRVDVTNNEDPAEKVSYWIAKDTRTVVKMAATLPSMGGATLSAELE